MANQTNVVFNLGATSQDLTLAGVVTTFPAGSKSADAGVVASDAEWLTISALTDIATMRGPLTRTNRANMREIARHKD